MLILFLIMVLLVGCTTVPPSRSRVHSHSPAVIVMPKGTGVATTEDPDQAMMVYRDRRGNVQWIAPLNGDPPTWVLDRSHK